jgi:hypothetical protein
MDDVTRIILATVCAVVAIGMFAYAKRLYVSGKRFRDQAELVTGRVIKIEARWDSEGSKAYHPVVQYITKDGETFTNTSTGGSSPASYKEGDAVEIYYDPQNPNVFEIKDFWSKWGKLIVTGGLGVMSGGFAISFFTSK